MVTKARRFGSSAWFIPFFFGIALGWSLEEHDQSRKVRTAPNNLILTQLNPVITHIPIMTVLVLAATHANLNRL